MDGALAFTHVCVDSSRTVLEHHRPFHSCTCTCTCLLTHLVCLNNIGESKDFTCICTCVVSWCVYKHFKVPCSNKIFPQASPMYMFSTLCLNYAWNKLSRLYETCLLHSLTFWEWIKMYPNWHFFYAKSWKLIIQLKLFAWQSGIVQKGFLFHLNQSLPFILIWFPTKWHWK